MIGILAYGSLITHPGHEIESVLDHVIPDILTPFPVEYARRSQSRAGAPTLVPVPIMCGTSVKAAVLVLREEIQLQDAMNRLYRRELHKEGRSDVVYDDQAQRQAGDKVIIEPLANVFGLSVVYFTMLNANFLEILDPNRTEQAKANLLVQAAIESVIQETFDKGLDGIQYLADNIVEGVATALTESYVQAILAKAGNASNLDIK